MAFDFPNSPTLGQIYDPGGGFPRYQWNGYGWITAAVQTPKAWMSLSTAPPSSPVDGDFWWQTDTGLMMIRYNDGNSTQWVVVQPANDVAGLDTRYRQIADGGLFKVSSGVLASAAAQVDILMPAGYTAFELLLGGGAPVTTAQALVLRLSNDNGVSFQAANYQWAMNTTSGAGTNTPGGNTSSTFIALHQAMSNASGTRYGGRVFFPPVIAGVSVPSVLHQGHHYDGTNYSGTVGWGTISSGFTGLPNAVRVLTTSGNLQSGLTWQLNGYK